jgi:hypothetical protein
MPTTQMEPRRQKRSRSFERKTSNIQSITGLCAFKVKAYRLVDGAKLATAAPSIKDIQDYYWIHESGVDKIRGLGCTGSQYVYFKVREGHCGKETSILFILSDSLDDLVKYGMSESSYKKYLHDTN